MKELFDLKDKLCYYLNRLEVLDMDTKLNVVNDNGEKLTIDVIDIFSPEGDTKEYMLYSVGDDIYASILIEDDNTFALKTIEDEKEMEIVKERISQLVS